jgi:molybdenum cofactor guanylyltransferase
MNPKPPLPPFAAVLLAGGLSTRMGRDKAGLVIDGQPLWQRQLGELRLLNPAELFISGRPDGPYAGAGVEIVMDAVPGLGPLAGIAAALQRTTAPLLLVLAIDLPDASATFLGRLVAEARLHGSGMVPQRDGWFEPLAAVYPRAALPLATETLHGDDRSMQTFVRRLIAAGLVAAFPITGGDLARFRNLNESADLSQPNPT